MFVNFQRYTLFLRHRIILILLLGFLLRITPVVYLEWREPGWHDNNIDEIEFYYDDVARSLIVGGGFVHSVNPHPNTPIHFEPGTPFHFVPPLYAWWVALLYLVFGPNLLIAKLFQALMDASVCLLLFALAKRITGDRIVGLLAALLYAVYPFAIYMNRHLYYQIPLNLALVWLALAAMSPIGWRSGLWTGLALAATALAKPVTLPLIAIIPIVKLAECCARRIPVKVGLLWCVCFFGATLAALAPWTIRNYMVFQRFVPIQHGGGATMFNASKEEFIDLDVVTYRRLYKDEIAAARDNLVRAAIANHWERLSTDPFGYARFMAKKFAFNWYNCESKSKNNRALLAQLPFLLLAIAGLVFAHRLWFQPGHWYVPALVLYQCGIGMAFNPFLRYTLAFMPLVMVIAAVGGISVGRLFRETGSAPEVITKTGS